MDLQFDELSRKAAAGTLSPAERDWLEAYLHAHPTRRAELEWDEAFRAKLDDKVASMPAMPGWERTVRAMRKEQPAPRASSAMLAPGILDRIAGWIRAWLGVGINMQAVAAMLVLAQAGVIGVLVWEHRDYSEFRTGTQTDAPRGPLLRVSFKQDLREADLRQALADIGAEIVGGPGQVGIYLLRVKGGDLLGAAEKLRASGTTELVEIFTAKP